MSSHTSPTKEVEAKPLQCSHCLQNFSNPKPLPSVQWRQKLMEKDNTATPDCPFCKSERMEMEHGTDGVGDSSSASGVKVLVTEREESVVDIEGIKDNEYKVRCITSCEDGRFVISGYTSFEYSFISVINIKGEIIREDKMEKVTGSSRMPCRQCDSLSPNYMVTLCPSGEIGIYDIRDGSHIKKNIDYIMNSWTRDRFITCITADPVDKSIYVGSMNHNSCGISRDVFVFDDKLNDRHTLMLPEMIRGSFDITLHDGHLLVCDYHAGKAHVVTIDGQEAKHVHEFIKPDHDGGYWRPYRVYNERNGSIFILWQVYVHTSKEWRRVLTQYSQDRHHLLRSIPMVGFPTGLCAVVTDQGEKLLVAENISGKLYTYGLST